MTATAFQPARAPDTSRRRTIVVALGRNALLGGGGLADAGARRRNVAVAVDSISDLAVDHDVVVTHGSGLQGMIAYLLEQGLDGTPASRPLRRVTPDDLRRLAFAPGSMAPKVRAACRFVEATGGVAAIGGLADARALLYGRGGTTVQAARDLEHPDGRAARQRLALVPATVAAVSRGRSAALRGRA
jgi:carbamate kinase